MHPLPSVDERRANAVYEAMLWALSRPGRVQVLPEAGEEQIVDALLDRECRVHAADPRLIPAVVRSGAEVAALELADHVFLGELRALDALERLAQGSDLYPDDGATVILSAEIGAGPRLRLSGPGVDGALEIRIGGLPAAFWAERARVMRYPMGFDLFFLQGAQIVGLPRSTHVEVL